MLWNAKNGEVAVGATMMSYVSFGSGEKVLILLPGLSDGLATVRGKAMLLAAPYRCFFDRYTVYMFSRKDEMPEGYSIRQMAADQALALQNLGLKKVSVMGVSEGGMIAQYLAVDFPGLVEKLVLCVTAAHTGPVAKACVEHWIELARQGRHRQLMIDTAKKSYSPKYLRKYKLTYPLLGLVGRPADGYRRFLINADAILSFDATLDLWEIGCPTLILGGAEDQIVGAAAAYGLAERIPHSEVWIYEGLGHAAYEEAPDFCSRVLAFLEKKESPKQ